MNGGRLDFGGDFEAQLVRELREKMEQGVLAAVLIAHKETVKQLSKPGSGRVYKNGNRTKRRVKQTVTLLDGSQRTLSGRRNTHQASAPGEAPAADTGRLRASMSWTQPKWQGDTVSCDFGTNVVYARRLEFGGRHAVKARNRGIRRGVRRGESRRLARVQYIYIAPRPFIRPAMEAAKPQMDARLKKI